MKTAEELLDNTSHMNWLTDSQKLLVTSMMEVYKDLALENEVEKLDLAFVSKRSEQLKAFAEKVNNYYNGGCGTADELIDKMNSV